MTSTTPQRRSQHLLVLVGLAAFASALAVVLRLGHSLSVDEPFMANAVRLPWTELRSIFRTDNVPFAYVALRGWTALFGESELALRGLSIAAYAAAVLCTGLAAAPRGHLAAMTAAALMASSVRIGITHAATARPYALLAAFSAAATWLTIRSLDPAEGTRTSWRRFVGLTAVHLLGLFTHPTYVFVLAACGLAAAVTQRVLRAPAVLATGTALALYVVIWGPVLIATVGSQATSWMAVPRLADIKAAFLFLWGPGPGFMLAGAIVALALSHVSRVREVLRDRQVRWAALATVIAWSAPILVSLWQPVFLPARTPAMLLPITAVLIAFVLSALASRAAVLTLVGVLLIAAVSQVLGAVRAGDPAPSRASIQQVLSAASCGDTLVAVGLSHAPVEYYVRQLQAPECITRERFPADMMNWTGRVADGAEMKRVQEEAGALVARVSSRAGTVWVLSADGGIGHEASGIFVTAVRDRLRCGDPMPLKGAFFDHVIRCGG